MKAILTIFLLLCSFACLDDPKSVGDCLRYCHNPEYMFCRDTKISETECLKDKQACREVCLKAYTIRYEFKTCDTK